MKKATAPKSKRAKKSKRSRSSSKSLVPRKVKALSPAVSGRWFRINDTWPGAWQQDVAIELDSVLTFAAVFACIRLIYSDISKLAVKLVRFDSGIGIWRETTSPQFSPVLRKPNPVQTRIKFFASWVISKLIFGNTYVLKRRDSVGRVVAMWVLNPEWVEPLVSDSGEVFYRLKRDNLPSIPSEIVVPATEIIHDVHFTPEHPLIGVSPIGACGLAATQGKKIQANSEKFFANMSRPGGMLSAPGAITDETAARLKTAFEESFGGDNIGRLAVAGDGLKFEGFAMNATDAQLIEQLKWTAEDVCRAFGVPAYKVGVGQMPAYNNIEALDQAYYSQTLQELIECIELLLDEGLEMPEGLGTEFDLDGLLRMDSKTQSEVMEIRTRAGILAPNEGRRQLGYAPVVGGNTPYLQQQNYSLSALKDRDIKQQQETSDVQAQAMNGAQVTSLQGLIVAAANGEIPVETARAAIAAAFPLLTSEQIDQMIVPLAEFQPEPVASPPADPEKFLFELAVKTGEVLNRAAT